MPLRSKSSQFLFHVISDTFLSFFIKRKMKKWRSRNLKVKYTINFTEKIILEILYENKLTWFITLFTKTKNLEIVRILIEHGSEINALANRKEGLNSSTWSPLCGAVQKANLELVKLLIENGAELNPKTKNSGVPLHFAVTSAFR